jgi:hypothetical protein
MEDRILGHTDLEYKRGQGLDNVGFVNIFGHRVGSHEHNEYGKGDKGKALDSLPRLSSLIFSMIKASTHHPSQ